MLAMGNPPWRRRYPSGAAGSRRPRGDAIMRAMVRPESRTLPDLLDEMAERHPAREFVVGAGGERLSYAVVRDRARHLAAGLAELGVARGDTVALLMNNRPEWIVADFAVTLLGATLVPLSTWSRPRELGYVLDHSDASTLITVPGFLGQDFLAALAELGGPGSARLPRLRRVVVAGGASGAFPALDEVERRG